MSRPSYVSFSYHASVFSSPACVSILRFSSLASPFSTSPACVSSLASSIVLCFLHLQSCVSRLRLRPPFLHLQFCIIGDIYELFPPFEFQALEVALEAICHWLDARTKELEASAYPILDELTCKEGRKPTVEELQGLNKDKLHGVIDAELHGLTNEEERLVNVQKNKRGPTLMGKLTAAARWGKKVKIDYDNMGRPPYNANGRALQSYIGSIARSMVLINIKSWPDIPENIKQKVWEEISKEERVESVQKIVLEPPPGQALLERETDARGCLNFSRRRWVLRDLGMDKPTPFAPPLWSILHLCGGTLQDGDTVRGWVPRNNNRTGLDLVKCRSIAAVPAGVVSVSWDRDRLIVVGEGIDSVTLTVVLRKKMDPVGVELLSVGPYWKDDDEITWSPPPPLSASSQCLESSEPPTLLPFRSGKPLGSSPTLDGERVSAREDEVSTRRRVWLATADSLRLSVQVY
ncbi:hypothetical protein ZIOFF_020234 [Zingiber officinale]|uniref:Uncharacterized protein n=1 Tax=Zingiber officinale TaxID=94328 RepID=A0A8J5HHY3_ZINOF|nr:hypothetical protein ZIOFF_020234 [Zingiber officinale]